MLILKTKTLTQRKRLRIFRRRCFYTQALLHTHTGASKHNFDTGACIYTEAFTHRSSYTQQQHTHTHGCLLQTDSFSLRADACTQVLSHTHTGSFTRRSFYTPALSHTGTFTHRSFYTHTRKHTHTMFVAADAFTHGSSDTHTHTKKKIHPENLSCRSFYMQMLLHTESFCTQTHLHEGAFTHRCFYAECSCTQMGSHTFTHRCLETQAPLHIEALHTDRFTQRTPLHTLLIE